jgi:putative acetyltransferase
MNIRLSDAHDHESICRVHHSAFSEDERDSVVELARAFLSEPSDYSVFSFVAEEDGVVVGHVLFSETRFTEHGAKASILAPLAVLPASQKKGVGKSLVKHGLAYLASQGAEVVLVYGDPAYYSRFGFLTEQSDLFVPPYGLEYPHGWQYLQLNSASLPAAPVHLSCAPPLRKPELW